MYRDVQINIPMFIGIILLVAVVTAGLVYGVNAFRGLMYKNNEKVNSESENLDKWFNTEEVDEGIYTNEITNEVANFVINNDIVNFI